MLPWAIAAVPVIGLVITGTATGVSGLAGLGIIYVAILVQWLTTVILAVRDHNQLRQAGWYPATWAWALLSAWVYLLARALRRRRLTPQPGWPQLAVCAALTLIFLTASNAVGRYGEPAVMPTVSTAEPTRFQGESDAAEGYDKITGPSVCGGPRLDPVSPPRYGLTMEDLKPVEMCAASHTWNEVRYEGREVRVVAQKEQGGRCYLRVQLADQPSDAPVTGLRLSGSCPE